MDDERERPQRGRVMRLFDMCQVAVSRVVDLRNALPVLEWADLTQAHLLKDYTVQVRISLLPLAAVSPDDELESTPGYTQNVTDA
jgi:hypothetical protein